MGHNAVRPKLRVVGGRETPPAPTSTVGDAELLAAILNGDQDAAGALHDRVWPRVAATVRRLLGTQDPDVEDCMQNAFVEIVRSIDRYRGDCALEHWAARVAAHVVFKHIRRRRLERKIFDGPARPSERPEPMSSSRLLVVRDLVARIRVRLEGLEENKTTTFLLHDVLGFDLAEIAEITGVTVAAAQKRLVRGRRDVHAELAADPELAWLGTSPEDGA